MEIANGKKAPAFSLPDQDGKMTSLKDFAGSWVVLYFYPKDNTPGCTIEAKDFTALAGDFKKQGAKILGVSADSEKSHCNFIEKQGLGITLLSDLEKKVIGSYGVWQVKKLYGKESQGIARTTYLIGPDGTVARVWEKVKTDGHAEEVLKALKELKAG